MTHFFYQLCVLSSFATAFKLNLPPLASLAWCFGCREKKLWFVRVLKAYDAPSDWILLWNPQLGSVSPSVAHTGLSPLGHWHGLADPNPRLDFCALLGSLHLCSQQSIYSWNPELNSSLEHREQPPVLAEGTLLSRSWVPWASTAGTAQRAAQT